VKTSNLREKVDNLPQSPGSYIFKDSSGKVIYVGKAKNLRNRVKSYFSFGIPKDFKTSELVRRINDLEFIKVDSEFEAILLEAELIKKYRPKYNIVLKDDKSKIYIVIRNEILKISEKNYRIPKVIALRKPGITGRDIVFGPYPNYVVVRNILATSRKIFPFRDCSTSKFSKYMRIKSPCLYGHIGLCTAPCVNYNPVALLEYRKNISGLKKLLSGRITKLTSGIKKEMEEDSRNEKFENAAYKRDLLEKFYYVQRTFREAEEYMNNPYLIDDIGKKSIEDVKSMLPFLKKIPARMECYDISNISGKEAVGSIVVAINGKIDKGEYRKFRIKFKQKPDDFAMIYEVLYRRLKRETKKDEKKSWGMPDLVIVDGGKPQVTAGESAVKDLDLTIPVIGLAKKYETIVYMEDGVFKEKNFPKNSLGMRLIINLRNEAHRFAQSYHHLLREKSLHGKL
jgi:excinuclease ABC subunit C